MSQPLECPSTRAGHGGERDQQVTDAITTPIQLDTKFEGAFRFTNSREMAAYITPSHGSVADVDDFRADLERGFAAI